MSSKIRNIEGLQILDSRGDPTVQVTVSLTDGTVAAARVPSGASTGASEAHELRDEDKTVYGGRGVTTAVSYVNSKIKSAVIGHLVTDQRGIDTTLIDLDGTENKKNLGANAMLGVSLACARAAAISEKMPLYAYIRSLSGIREKHYTMPVPFVNVVNGGKHASSNLDLQEFWIIPHAAEKMSDRIRQASEIFHALGDILRSHKKDTDVGNEGGYAPDFESHSEVFEYILDSIDAANLAPGDDVSLGLDAGASVLFDSSTEMYSLPLEDRAMPSQQMISYYMDLVEKYPILAMEDPLDEEDWDAWQELTARLKMYNPSIRLVGDDLFVTNVKRLQKGINTVVANSVLIKPNQIGTLSETLDCIALAQKHNYSTAISHRSGETSDSFIADLAVGVNSEYIKTGSMARGERLSKYNRLLEIESELHG